MKTKLSGLIFLFVLLLVGCDLFRSSSLFIVNAQSNNTTPGTLQSYVTANSIGFEWAISGDGDHDASVTVQYRQQGTAVWKPALSLFRVDFNGFNMLAGSILFLDPGVTYEVQLALSDPDGGSDNRTLTLATRSEPTLPTGGRT
ncbi:MAG: hypothetical protein P8183_17510, partial [Anaerolineae bacterium]